MSDVTLGNSNAHGNPMGDITPRKFQSLWKYITLGNSGAYRNPMGDIQLEVTLGFSTVYCRQDTGDFLSRL